MIRAQSRMPRLSIDLRDAAQISCSGDGDGGRDRSR
jgi:hypothetical protein